MDKLIAEIKQFCIDNYENGYDAVVECWDYNDYIEWLSIGNKKTLDEFIKSYAVIIERRSEIESTAF